MIKTIFCDAHIHLSHSQKPFFDQNEQYLFVSSCHSREDFDFFSGATAASRRSCLPPFADAHCRLGGNFGAPATCAFASYGIHPQSVNPAFMESQFQLELSFLDSLCQKKKIIAIGECGFDFFTPEYKATAALQEIAFDEQLFLAEKYGLPLVLHLRKSIEKIFTYSKELKKIPAVIFHSFPGTLREALSLKNHGINAFFSFGKPLLNGKKSALDCMKNLPLENILLETDAPYQRLKGETATKPEEIKLVYQQAASIRNIPLEELQNLIYDNFIRSFGKTVL